MPLSLSTFQEDTRLLNFLEICLYNNALDLAKLSNSPSLLWPPVLRAFPPAPAILPLSCLFSCSCEERNRPRSSNRQTRTVINCYRTRPQSSSSTRQHEVIGATLRRAAQPGNSVYDSLHTLSFPEENSHPPGSSRGTAVDLIRKFSAC